MRYRKDKEQTPLYIDKTAASKLLRLFEYEFEALCIIKHVHPKTPENKKERRKYGDKETLYLRQDIDYLRKDALAETMRGKRSWKWKMQKITGLQDEVRLRKAKEHYKTILKKQERLVDETLLEIFPTFEDALFTLDDTLSFVFFFSTVSKNYRIGTELIDECRELSRDFLETVTKHGLIEKAFISVKGLYLECAIRGSPARWVMPHTPAHDVPGYAEPEILGAFLLLHTRKLHFVLHHLKKTLGDRTPEKRLFSGKRVFFSREVPSKALRCIVASLGGEAGWDGPDSPFPAAAENTTHEVVDRTQIESAVLGRKYTQPQWVVDCLNASQVLDENKYAPGQHLPPHASPFEAEDSFALVKKKRGMQITDRHGHVVKTSLELHEDIKYETSEDEELEMTAMEPRDRKLYKKLKRKDRMGTTKR